VSEPFSTRAATPHDVNDILNLATQITGLSRERAREIVTDATASSNCFLTTDASGNVVGYAVLSRKAFFGRDFVRLIAVSDRHRRLGVASALLETALAASTTESVFISTNVSNAPMRSLLVRDGWTLSGTLTGIDDGDPEMVFWKRPNALTM
jgi:N-acetylglutamate synthase-like GNAT family acetyltransferase